VEEERKSDAAGLATGGVRTSLLDGFSSLFLFLAHFWTRLLFFFSIGWGERERESAICFWYIEVVYAECKNSNCLVCVRKSSIQPNGPIKVRTNPWNGMENKHVTSHKPQHA
jgi:hypothetical protein